VIKKIAFMFFSLCTFVAIRAHAEGGCPPGTYPQQGQGWQSCVPIPGNNQGRPATGPVGDVWVDGWQAIATDTPKGILGTSTKMLTRSAAEQAAIEDCRAKGGTDCVMAASVGNGCLAMVTGKTNYRIRNGSSKLEAEKKGMKDCEASDSSCAVYYSACSFPAKQ
jgi:hypothetical protein